MKDEDRISTFFLQGGKYAINDNEFNSITSPISNSMKYFLWLPDMVVLNYILQNSEIFKNATFLDYGAGLGWLVFLLNAHGFKCYYYDIFSQIKKDLAEYAIKSLGIEEWVISPVEVRDKKQVIQDSKVKFPENIDVVISLGIGNYVANTGVFENAAWVIYNTKNGSMVKVINGLRPGEEVAKIPILGRKDHVIVRRVHDNN